MNDPAEADLHERLQDALGRTPGNPLLVVSQKTVTGHAKGGAAAWQLDGVLRMLETGAIPGNRNLESVDPLERDQRHLDARRPPDPPRRAAAGRADHLLGFGHVSAVLAIAHPDTFLAARRRERARRLPAPRRPPPRRGRPAAASRPASAAAPASAAPKPTTATPKPRRTDCKGSDPCGTSVGVDLVDVPGLRGAARGHRVAGSSTRRSPPREQRAAQGDPRRLAARFAAKEAFLKAWSGSRCGQPPLLATIDLREIEVVDDGYGRPGLGCTARSRRPSARRPRRTSRSATTARRRSRSSIARAR